MSDIEVQYEVPDRDRAFNILKAIAIIFVVVSHSGGPTWLVDAAYIFGMPAFFMCMGYCFNLDDLAKPKTYVWKCFQKIYRPFWIWSVAFLVLHNFFLWIGILSESYGGVGGGIEPYSWHTFMQNLWSITFNLSGYDSTLCYSFWFFRSLLIGSLAFYGLYLVVRYFSKRKDPEFIVAIILLISAVLLLWQVLGNLQVTGIAQGGYRELLAVMFIGLGFLYRRYQRLLQPQVLYAVLGGALLILFTWLSPSAMLSQADFVQFMALPLPAVGAFLVLHFCSQKIAEYDHLLTHALQYIGERALYVLAFHLLAFKLVSVIKGLTYDLPWSHVGTHPVVADYPGDYFFVLYIICGVALPLLVREGWLWLDRAYDLTWCNSLLYLWRGLLFILNFIKKIIFWISLRIWNSVKDFFHDLKAFIKASNPSDE